MGLTLSFIDTHIASWEQRLASSHYPHRRHWPSRLFHHAPLENTASILQTGLLLSRIDSKDLRVRDIAGTGVIDSSLRAHRYARLYFRPRTPTQYHIEGISRQSDRPSYCDKHAPILFMFAFDARRVLSIPAVCFAGMNMQAGVIEGATQEYFEAIPFDKVYHEGGTGGDTLITKYRCAEVLAPSPLPIDDKLHLVYCRSEAERMTLLNTLGNCAAKWSKKIKVSDDLEVFQKRFTFVRNVSLANDGVFFALKPRDDWQPVAIDMRVYRSNGSTLRTFSHSALEASTNLWKLPATLPTDSYRVVIRLDGELAFDAWLKIDNVPF